MNKIITVTAAALSVVAVAGPAAAADDYVNQYEVPGHAQQAKQGKVVTHWTVEDEGCDVIVNTLGDFDGDPYMNDGQMLNIYRCPDGTVMTYHIFHKSHPAFTGEREPIWGSWEYFVTTNDKG